MLSLFGDGAPGASPDPNEREPSEANSVAEVYNRIHQEIGEDIDKLSQRVEAVSRASLTTREELVRKVADCEQRIMQRLHKETSQIQATFASFGKRLSGESPLQAGPDCVSRRDFLYLQQQLDELQRKVRGEGDGENSAGRSGDRPPSTITFDTNNGEHHPDSSRAVQKHFAQAFLGREVPPSPIASTARITPAPMPISNGATDNALVDRMSAIEASVTALEAAVSEQKFTHEAMMVQKAEMQESIDQYKTEMLGKIDSLVVEHGPSAKADETAIEDDCRKVVALDVGPTSEIVVAENPSKPTHRVMTKERLSSSNMYQFNESVWDAAAFIGLECVGWDVSFFATLALFGNIFIQLSFIYMTLDVLVQNPLSDDELSNMLRFRVTVAHDIKNADSITKRSMVRQLCDQDHSLPLSGNLMSFYGDMIDFFEKAQPLCILAQFIWVATILKEINTIYSFWRSISSVHVGATTELIVEDESGEEVAHQSSQDDSNTLVSLIVVSKMNQISAQRKVGILLLVVLPRFIIAAALGLVGIQYLGYTSYSGDLILNAMALAFIIDIDDLTYPLYIPRRMQTLVANMQPLPIKKDFLMRKCGSAWLASYHVLGKYILTAGIMLWISYAIIIPFFALLDQGTKLLCSGDKDFVFTKNAATGMVDIARSAGIDASSLGWEELSITTLLQAAHPTIDDVLIEHGRWTLSSDVTAAIRSSTNLANLPDVKASLDEVTYSSLEFDSVLVSSSSSVASAATILSCADSGDSTPDALKAHLQDILGNDTIEFCDGNNTWLMQQCARKQNTYLRAVCPQTCGCQDQQAVYLGFYGGVSWGCPHACSLLMESNQEFWLSQGYYDDCEDLDADDYPARAGEDGQLYYYFNGLATYATNRASWLRNLPDMIASYGASIYGIPVDRYEEFYYDTINMAILQRIGNGKWDLIDGYSLPADVLDSTKGNLTGCAFWTSWQINLLYSMDLCTVGEFRSIRFLCPEACGCSETKTLECPLSCQYEADALPDKSGDFDSVKGVDLDAASDHLLQPKGPPSQQGIAAPPSTATGKTGSVVVPTPGALQAGPTPGPTLVPQQMLPAPGPSPAPQPQQAGPAPGSTPVPQQVGPAPGPTPGPQGGLLSATPGADDGAAVGNASVLTKR